MSEQPPQRWRRIADRADPLPRRDVLRLAGAAALTGALAACTGTASRSGTTKPSTPTRPSPRPSTGSAAPTYSELADQIPGGLLRPGHPGYDPAALLYNPRFTAAPQAIARCRTRDDVAACVRFAAAGGAPLRLRNGGHSYGGWSAGAGLVADLSPMNTVHVDTAAATATIGAGARLAEVYPALAAKGMSIGAGSCATVGVTGLTLGGGVGVLTRTYGLTCDQLRSAEVVTAGGTLRTVSADTHPDLFWALRGGGGSFAAVTSLTFAVRPAPTVSTFFLQWSWSAAAEVLTAWQHWIRSAPRELWSTCKLLTDPGAGSTVTVSGTWIGSGSPDSPLHGLLRMLPVPSHSYRNRTGYGETMLAEAGCSGQSAESCIAEALTPAKRQPFAATSSIMQRELPDQGVTAIIEAVAAASGVPHLVEGGVSFDALGGAVADIGPTGTAFPWRQALATVQYTATWAFGRPPAPAAPFDAFVRGARRTMTPWWGSSAYVNYADPSIADFPPAYWGASLPRLQQVKHTYDPRDVFSFPQSVPL